MCYTSRFYFSSIYNQSPHTLVQEGVAQGVDKWQHSLLTIILCEDFKGFVEVALYNIRYTDNKWDVLGWDAIRCVSENGLKKTDSIVLVLLLVILNQLAEIIWRRNTRTSVRSSDEFRKLDHNRARTNILAPAIKLIHPKHREVIMHIRQYCVGCGMNYFFHPTFYYAISVIIRPCWD